MANIINADIMKEDTVCTLLLEKKFVKTYFLNFFFFLIVEMTFICNKIIDTNHEDVKPTTVRTNVIP